MKFYQKYTRKNDPTGNAYRLLMVYSNHAVLQRIILVGTSCTSNIEYELIKDGYTQIYQVTLTPGEFNNVMKAFKDRLEVMH